MTPMPLVDSIADPFGFVTPPGIAGLCWAALPWNDLLASPLAWGVIAGAVSLLLLIPGSSQRSRTPGLLFAAAALILLGWGMGRSESLGAQLSFWVLATLTVGSAGAAIAMRSAVYSAIWFAVSLLGTGGLFCLQNAQFLGVATVVVYAGAIVVTFLFVVMLAQPEGHDAYDRISWGPLAKPVIVGSAAVLLGLVLGTVGPALGVMGAKAPKTAVLASSVSEASPTPRSAVDTIDGRGHMARLGGVLFSRHLLAVELGGTLLLAALVGAVAIVIQGRDERAKQPGDAGEERDHG
jgi:NADH-quinone oxidoreductase subunit J